MIHRKDHRGPERSSHFCTHRHSPAVTGCSYRISEAASLTVSTVQHLGRLSGRTVYRTTVAGITAVRLTVGGITVRGFMYIPS